MHERDSPAGMKMAAARRLRPTTNEDHEYTNGAAAWAIRVFVAVESHNVVPRHFNKVS